MFKTKIYKCLVRNLKNISNFTHLEVVCFGSEHNFKWLKKLIAWRAKG